MFELPQLLPKDAAACAAYTAWAKDKGNQPPWSALSAAQKSVWQMVVEAIRDVAKEEARQVSLWFQQSPKWGELTPRVDQRERTT